VGTLIVKVTVRLTVFIIHYKAPDYSIKEMIAFNNDTCTVLNRNSLLNGCGIEAESPVKLLCVSLVPDLQRIARTKAD
jgi:hypothetical protein